MDDAHRRTLRASRSGRFELYCGQFTTSGVSGSCGAASRRVTSDGRAYLKLAPVAFVAKADRRVRVRFKLSPYALGRLKAAKKLRMTGRITAAGPLGGTTSRATSRFTLKAPKPA